MSAGLIFESFPPLDIERRADGLIELRQQEGYTEPAVVLLNPTQARRVGELAGLADDGGQLLRLVAMVRRRLSTINAHAERLDHWLRHCSDHAHADLLAEMQMAGALADMVADLVADVQGGHPVPQASPSPEPVTRDGPVTAAGVTRDGAAAPMAEQPRAKQLPLLASD